MTWIKTYSGLKFNYLAPLTDEVSAVDVAQALSREQRFGGHLGVRWSVGQHTLLVRKLVELKGGTKDQKFIALHHDSPEAYMKDIPTPLKNLLPDYQVIYQRVLKCVEKRFMVTLSPLDKLVEEQDKLASYIESLLFFDYHNEETDWCNFTIEDYKDLVYDSKGELDSYIRKLRGYSPDKIVAVFMNYHFKPQL